MTDDEVSGGARIVRQGRHPTVPLAPPLDEVKVFGYWPSPFSYRVQLALNLKGIPYEYIEEDIRNKSSSFLNYNAITKKVPVIVHNGKSMAESLVILEYIDEAWKNDPILPQSPPDRAMARFWAHFIDDKVLGAARRISYSEGKEREDAIEEMNEHLKVLDKELEGKDFFGGKAIGYLDIAASLIAVWLGIRQEVSGLSLFTEQKHPNLWKWKTKFEENEVAKQCLPPRRKLVQFLASIFKPSK